MHDPIIKPPAKSAVRIPVAPLVHAVDYNILSLHLIIDIATALNAEKVTITSMNIRETQGGGAVAYLTVLVHDRDELTAAMRRLRGLRGVKDVVRPGV